MARPRDSEHYNLSDAEKRDLIKLIEQGKPLPEKYRFLLFADKREVELVWNGDVLSFSRSGVEGSIALAKGLVKVHVKLGFLLGMMRGPIEQEIERVLDQEFG